MARRASGAPRSGAKRDTKTGRTAAPRATVKSSAAKRGAAGKKTHGRTSAPRPGNSSSAVKQAVARRSAAAPQKGPPAAAVARQLSDPTQKTGATKAVGTTTRAKTAGAATPRTAENKPGKREIPAANVKPTGGAAYERHKERARKRAADQSEKGRDIGPLPAVQDPARRERGRTSYATFCLEYFPETFCLPFSPDHLEACARIEEIAHHDGFLALAMPRGSGKTSLCECGVLWMVLYGYRRFALLIGANGQHARDMLESILTTLETNERLAADFPEVIYPLLCLEGIHNRARGQLHLGEPTRIGLRKNRIVLPTMYAEPVAPGQAESTAESAESADEDMKHAFISRKHACMSTPADPNAESGPEPQKVPMPASGAIIGAVGLHSRIRGHKHKTSDGKTLRPDAALLDDLQTDESARSAVQCDTRMRKIKGEIPGLAGPGKRLAAMAAVTVICRGDVADQLTDARKNPQWHGKRTKLMPRLPTNEKLWDEHRQLWLAGHTAGEKYPRAAHAFYLEHRAELDAGAEVSWPERKGDEDASAIEHAMCLRWEYGEAGWLAEFQNDPPDQAQSVQLLDPVQLLTRNNGLPRGVAPSNVHVITAYIDVQGAALYGMVVGWTDQFAGYVLDYSTEPEQDISYFTLREIPRTLQHLLPGEPLEAAIRAGLERYTARLLNTVWRRVDGTELRIERLLIDARWGTSTDTVFDFCRASTHGSVVMPAMGKGIGPGDLPLREYKSEGGDKLGTNWKLTASKRGLRYLLIDTNAWKTFVARRLAAAVGDRSALTFWGKPTDQHHMLVDHLTAEASDEQTSEKFQRTLTVWKAKPNRDNHWFDGLAGAAAAASERGVTLPGAVTPARPVRKVRLSDMQEAARRRREER